MSSPTAATSEAITRNSRKDWRERSARMYAEFEESARAMVRRAFRGAFGEDELDDIYSNAWLGTLRALEHRHEELSDEEVRSYVFAAVAHQASREIRRRRRKPTAPLEAVLGRPDFGPTPDEQAASEENSRVTRDLLASLPPRRRSVMLLRYGWGLDPQQVCGLIEGLSPRAYRKEVTRGVDELTEKVRAFERGEWCVDREPVLKAYAAGVADVDQARQAEAHLSHCRECKDFVGRLSGHLHDLGSATLAPTAVDGLNGDLSWTDRLGEVADRARDGIAGLVGRSPSAGAEDAVAAVASSGGAKGAGVAGAGLAAKLAGIGAAAKVTAACVGGGIAATACIAAGVGPVDIRPDDPGNGPKDGLAAGQAQEAAAPAPAPAPETLPSQVDAAPAVPPAQAPDVAGEEQAKPQGSDAGAERGTPAPSAPVAPEAPVQTREFGVEAAAAPTAEPASSQTSTGGGGDTTSGGGSTPTGASTSGTVRQEFGP